MKEFSTGGFRYKTGLVMTAPQYIATIYRINEKTGQKNYLCFFKKNLPRRAVVAAFKENDKAEFYRTNN